MASTHPFLDAAFPLAIAHRGGAADFPENTMAAFRHAASLGITHFETDVHLTVDGQIIAFHDDRLERVTNGVGMVLDKTMDEIREAKIAGSHDVVMMSDLLEEFPDHFFNIDPKDDAVLEPLARLLDRRGDVARVCLGSFSDARLARARELLGPALCTSGGPRAIAALRVGSLGVPMRRVKTSSGQMNCVQVPVRSRGVTLVDARFVRYAHKRGLPVHVWTIDEPQDMHRLLDLGVDGIMTDRPRLLRDVLISRGQWSGPDHGGAQSAE